MDNGQSKHFIKLKNRFANCNVYNLAVSPLQYATKTTSFKVCIRRNIHTLPLPTYLRDGLQSQT